MSKCSQLVMAISHDRALNFRYPLLDLMEEP